MATSKSKTKLKTPVRAIKKSIASTPAEKVKVPEPMVAVKRARSKKVQEGHNPVQTPRADAALEQKLANQPPRALNSPIRVFQMYSESWQRELLDPAFYPMDVSRVDPHNQDLNVWSQLMTNEATKGAQLWGAVSWRFTERTSMNGSDWVRQVTDQPGGDVYFSNTDLVGEGVFHNSWLHAATLYPQFLEVVTAFFQANDLPLTELSLITPSALTPGGHFMLARPVFWSAYVNWLKQLMTQANKRMPPALRDLMHSPLAGGDGKSTLLSVIVDRLLPVFLRQTNSSFKAIKVALPERERELNVHQKLLREMKDVAHRTQSAWMAACWVNYRNLYLSQSQSKAWIQQHLRAVTPTEIKFA